jgi:hypothetical protein
VVYTADENGFNPVGDHLPTPPPIPPASLTNYLLHTIKVLIAQLLIILVNYSCRRFKNPWTSFTPTLQSNLLEHNHKLELTIQTRIQVDPVFPINHQDDHIN